ncbi:hypothetical protein TNCT_4681 [Trichonephila clavata]|uniref:Uncharacterized protein n=1 Tax=Trichonephila clavata TaxID=2740835 RepID=A0A8X6KWW6_TRICU|nr:hypothetical protein TNCT_4681 [Trichonephila clavata]
MNGLKREENNDESIRLSGFFLCVSLETNADFHDSAKTLSWEYTIIAMPSGRISSTTYFHYLFNEEVDDESEFINLRCMSYNIDLTWINL